MIQMWSGYRHTIDQINKNGMISHDDSTNSYTSYHIYIRNKMDHHFWQINFLLNPIIVVYNVSF